MTGKRQVKKTAKGFLRKMGGSTKFSDVEYYLNGMGWRIYLFNGVDEKGDTLIATLKLQEFAENKRSFLAQRDGHRFIFIRSHQSEKDATHYLLHETGHIMRGHLGYQDSIINATAEKEDEANQFAQYAMNHTHGKNSRRRRIVIATLVVLLFIAYYQGDLMKERTKAYFVQDGKSYHRQVCTYTAEKDAIETNIKDAEQMGLEACPVCKPKPE